MKFNGNIGIATTSDMLPFSMAITKRLKKILGCKVFFYVTDIEAQKNHNKYVHR